RGEWIGELAADANAVTAVVVDVNGERRVQPASHVISTMPLRDLVSRMAPAAPATVRQAADRLKYRDFLTVALVVDQADVFPDNWIYIHDPSVRVHKAYPVYDAGYRDAIAQVREWAERFTNLQLVGRNGMHKYNNQDHSMLTARLAVRNVFGERHDLWAVNADDEYHEDGGERA